MLKSLLMVSSVIIASPVIAQEGGAVRESAPSSTPQAASAPPDQGAAGAAETTDQVSSIVNAEFATYDRDGNGTLEKAEFAAWMDALKAKAPDGGAQVGDAKWNEAAFAQADTDKSSSLTRAELTGFLGASVKSGAD